VVQVVRGQKLKGKTLVRLTTEQMQQQFGIEHLQAMQLSGDVRENLDG